MKILHILSQHPESTGSGYYLQNVLRQAATAGYGNHLIAGSTYNLEHQLDCIAAESCNFVVFDREPLDFSVPGMSDVMPYKSTRFKEMTRQQLTQYKESFTEIISQVAETYKPDIIHSHHLWLVSGITRKLLPEIPMVTSCHSTDLRQFQQCEHLQTRVLPGCQEIDRIIALSPDQAKKITELYAIEPGKIDIVGSGYNSNLFTMKDQASAGTRGTLHLLYAGKLSYAKGVDLLLKAFSSLDQPDVHLHLAGTGHGPEAQHCLSLAAERPDSITLHGSLSQSDLAKLMQQSDIFILPSMYEGLPLVLLEALACGCRIITTNLPGCVELLNEVPDELAEIISLPPMATVDKPSPEGSRELEQKLTSAMNTMIPRVKRVPALPSQEINAMTQRYRWPAVFNSIATSYDRAIKMKANAQRER